MDNGRPGMVKKDSIATVARKKADKFAEETKFDVEAVHKLINMFHYEIDEDRSGRIEKEEFVKLMHQIGIQDDLLIDRNFVAWDLDNDGSIDFQEFITGLSTTQKGTWDEKLRMAFEVYDLDNNGKIDRDEMKTVLSRALKYSHPNMGAGDISVIVLDLFRVAGVDPEDELDFEQFKKGVKSKKIVADCFRPPKSLLEKEEPLRPRKATNPLWYKDF